MYGLQLTAADLEMSTGQSLVAAARGADYYAAPDGSTVARAWRFEHPVHEAPPSKSNCKFKNGIPAT